MLSRAAEAIRRATASSSVIIPDGPVHLAWLDPATCRNCGVALNTAYCGACGQKAAKRLSWRAFFDETWERVPLFELQMVKTAVRLLLAPAR